MTSVVVGVVLNKIDVGVFENGSVCVCGLVMSVVVGVVYNKMVEVGGLKIHLREWVWFGKGSVIVCGFVVGVSSNEVVGVVWEWKFQWVWF